MEQMEQVLNDLKNATFSVKDDGYKTYKEDYLGKLWEDSIAIEEANKMVRKMLGY